jgi:hypothetical protein
MDYDKTVLYFGPGRTDPSPLVSQFVRDGGFDLVCVDATAEVRALLNRTMPACLILEAAADDLEVVELVRVLKDDSFTGDRTACGIGDGGRLASPKCGSPRGGCR